MRTETEPELLRRTARELTVDEHVRVWLVRLDDPDAHDALAGVLSDDERARARAYPGETRARRFVRARGALRLLLGHLLHRPPAGLSFAYGRDGKPVLAADSTDGSVELHFNVSHARDLALIACAERRRIGVDLAWVDGEARLDAVAARFFSPPERAVYEAALPDARRAAFSRIWVRKEAYLKGRGDGISERIYETDFSDAVANRAGVASAASHATARDQDGWRYFDVAGLPSGYVASIALERLTT